MNPAQAYSMKLANDRTRITLTDFFKNVHGQFYQDQDVSFMEYFLELTQHENEFFVRHDKLVEYGIMTCANDSSKVKEKLNNLGLVDGQDWVIADVRDNPKEGGRPAKEYLLTPEAFKKCLMRAQRRANQPVDPVIYVDYYLLLEKVFKLYTDYEKAYLQMVNTILSEENQTLAQKVDENIALTREALDRLDSTETKLDTANKKLDVSNAKLNVLNSLGIKQYHLSRSMVRNLDHQQLTSNKLMNLTSDTLDQLNRMNVYVNDMHAQLETAYSHPALAKPKSPSTIGRIWINRECEDGSVDIIYGVGKKKHIDALVVGITKTDPGWEIMFDFRSFASGVNYNLTMKSFVVAHYREFNEKLNTKRASALATYPPRLHQYDIAKTNVETMTLQIDEKKAEAELVRHEIEVLEKDSLAKFNEVSGWYKAPVKHMKIHNAAETMRFSEETNNCEPEDDIALANIINTKSEWFQLKGLVEGSPPKKADFKSPLVKDLKAKLRKMEKEMKTLEMRICSNQKIVGEMESAKTPPRRMQMILDRINKKDEPHAVSELIKGAKIEIDDDANVEFKGMITLFDIIDSSKVFWDVKVGGYKLIQNSYTNFSKFKNILIDFEKDIQRGSENSDPIDVDVIQTQVEHLHTEKNEIENECGVICDSAIDINDIASKEIEFDGNTEVDI